MARKRILITAGATWVKVDSVRILTNIFTGKTGLFLANGLKAKGHSVTLFVNPHCVGPTGAQGLKTIHYRYFDEFKNKLVKILKHKDYDAIIHTAAVSDYKIKNIVKGKISSKKKHITLSLVPTEKVIKHMRALAKKSILIQFKLEYGRDSLIKRAYKSLKQNKSDYVVANAFIDLKKGYKAFLINNKGDSTTVNSKNGLLSAINKIVNFRS